MVLGTVLLLAQKMTLWYVMGCANCCKGQRQDFPVLLLFYFRKLCKTLHLKGNPHYIKMGLGRAFCLFVSFILHVLESSMVR